MKPDLLENSLCLTAHEAMPRCPAHFNTDVWAEIRRRERAALSPRFWDLFEWPSLFLKPRLTIAALAFAAAVGVAPAVAWVKAEQSRSLARQSLHFEVFTFNSSSGLPIPLNASLAPPSIR